MKSFEPGLVHAPVTPFKRDQQIDYDTYAKVIEFHLKNGADTLAVPMPEGEDMSLREEELRRILEFAIKQVKGRVPVIAQISDAGTQIAVDRAVYAEKLGAAALFSHPPYFWHPRASMVVEHLARIGTAVKLPFYICNPPVESVGTRLTTDIVLQLIERVPNLVGVVDAGLDFVFMEEIMSRGRALRPDFQLVAGQDFLVSAFALGGKSAVATLAGIAPRILRQVYELCRKEQFIEARGLQEDIAGLHHLVHGAGESGLRDGLAGTKRALALMGRECGVPRLPVRPLGEAERVRFDEALQAFAFLKAEPRGW